MSEFRLNSLSIDVDGLKSFLVDYFIDVLTSVEDELFRVLGNEIVLNGNGKIMWREEAAMSLRELYAEVAAEFVEVQYGFEPSGGTEYAFERVMVAMYGNQLNGPIRSKPGQEVFNNSMDGRHTSGAVTEYDIPQFNQADNSKQIMENAMKIMKKFFKDTLQNSFNSIPDSVFQGYLLVTAGW